MSWKSVVSDFLLGGLSIALAVLIAKGFSPFAAGIVAAFPVRLATTIALGSAQGTQVVHQMVLGAIPSNIGAMAFAVSLWLLPRRMTIRQSFAVGLAVCMALTLGLYLVIV